MHTKHAGGYIKYMYFVCRIMQGPVTFPSKHVLCDGNINQPSEKVNIAVCRRPSVRLSCVTSVCPTQATKIFGMFLQNLVSGSPLTSRQNTPYYGDRPRGTLPMEGLNEREVVKYSDFGPIDGYISKRCKIGVRR